MINFETLPVDTKLLVRDFESQAWVKRHFAKFENGVIFCFQHGRSSWTFESFHHLYDLDSWIFAELANGEEQLEQSKHTDYKVDELITNVSDLIDVLKSSYAFDIHDSKSLKEIQNNICKL